MLCEDCVLAFLEALTKMMGEGNEPFLLFINSLSLTSS